MRFGLRELIFLLVLAGLPVCSYFFVFKPTNELISEVRSENKVKQARLDRLELARHIEDLGEEIAKLSGAIDLFEDRLPEAKEVEVILREVWQLATRRGLNSRSVRTEDPEKCAGCLELPIAMELNGNFDGFYAFLLDLEKLPRITRIHEMKLNKLTDEEGHMEAQFTLSIFFEPQTGSTGKKA